MYRKRHREFVVDINKILFEQLNFQGTQTPLSVDDVNGIDDTAAKTSDNNEIKKEISSALNMEDEDSALQLVDKKETDKNKLSGKTLSNLTNTNNLINILSNEVKKYNKEEKELEKEIQSQNNEYEKLAEEIEEKQKEYESLISDAENSNDESIINSANSLGEEIKLLVSDLESLKTTIENLNTEKTSKESIANTFKSQLNSLSKVQSQLSKEAITTNSVTSADSVTGTSNKTSTDAKTTNEETSTWTVPDRVKQSFEGLKGEPHHSSHSYQEVLDGKCKLTAWECHQFHEAGDVKSFKDLNSIPDEVDIDGDGQISADEKYYMKNYKYTAYSSLIYSTNKNNERNNSVEEQIEILKFQENHLEIKEITQAYINMYKVTPDMIGHAYKEQSIQKKYDFSVDIGLISGVYQTLNQFDMDRYHKDGNYVQQVQNFGNNGFNGLSDAERDYQTNILAQVEQNNPLNKYKTYLLESNLSTEEYQNIIDKINNCNNENIKKQLGEILALAQQKIK